MNDHNWLIGHLEKIFYLHLTFLNISIGVTLTMRALGTVVPWAKSTATSAKKIHGTRNAMAPYSWGIRWYQNFWCRRPIFFFT